MERLDSLLAVSWTGQRRIIFLLEVHVAHAVDPDHLFVTECNRSFEPLIVVFAELSLCAGLGYVKRLVFVNAFFRGVGDLEHVFLIYFAVAVLGFHTIADTGISDIALLAEMHGAIRISGKPLPLQQVAVPELPGGIQGIVFPAILSIAEKAAYFLAISAYANKPSERIFGRLIDTADILHVVVCHGMCPGGIVDVQRLTQGGS